MEYQRCKRCVMDNSSDTTILFDENGFCNYCAEALKNKEIVYFPNKEGEYHLNTLLKKLKEEGKNKQYDCLMGISGGLDSSYLAYLGHQWGLRILAIHIDDGFDTDVAKENIRKLCETCRIELITIKLDTEQFNDLTKAFILAEVSNIVVPQDNILFSTLVSYARKYKIHSFLSGGNFALECILQKAAGDVVNAYDVSYIRDIHHKFGSLPVDKLKITSNVNRLRYRYLWGIHTYRPLNFIDYNRTKAIRELKEFCDFNYYELKHCENSLTKVAQLYWLVKKFNYDKRTSHLSSMIVSGQMTREEALLELDKPLYDEALMEQDIKFVLARLKLSREQFDEIVNRPGKSQTEYKTSLGYKIVSRYLKRTIVKFKG